MGYALAQVASDLGADTTLISGPTALTPPERIIFISVETTAQMFEATSLAFADADILLMAAAPADYIPAEYSKSKLKKSGAKSSLALKPSKDIIASLGRKKKNNQLLIGFAVETDNDIANATAKLEAKNLDMIILNNPNEAGAAFDHDTNVVTIIRPGQEPLKLELMSKADLSKKLLEFVAAML